MKKSVLAFGVLMAIAPSLAACGGGGGGAVSTVPQTPSSVAPPPPPPPPPPSSVDYNTAEYQRSNAATKIGALSAYQAGATGQGITSAVIDSGVNASLSEFSGKISSASRDVAGSRGLGDEDGHGTSVSAVLLGAKNDSDTHGVAINATLLALRTDTPGSCADTSPDGGCSHNDTNIAAAMDVAVANGAKVINLSLGGSSMNSTLRAAMNRATAAGAIIVISAGNDAATNPDGFALVANDAIARNLIIIAGGVDDTNGLSVFSTGGSNKAGIAASHYLTALASRVRTINENGAAVLASGTSYAAPAISGAVALLAQAFPNLTSAQIVDLLFTSARDLGDSGVDTVFGHGLLDLASAFAAKGSTSVAGTMIPVSTLSANGTLSAPMGDAAATGLSTVVLDAYGRAFGADLSGTFDRAYAGGRLWSSLSSRGQTAGVGFGATGVALSISGDGRTGQVGPLALSNRDQQSARAMAGWVVSRLSRETTFAMGFARSSGALIDQMALDKASQFLLAEAAGESFGFRTSSAYSGAVRHQLGPWGISAGWDRGDALVWSRGLRNRYDRLPYTAVSISLDRRFGPMALAVKATELSESETVLGARFGAMFGVSGAITRLVSADASVNAPMGWTLRGRWQQGWTRIGAGGVRPSADHLSTTAWSVDATRADIFAIGDSVGFRLAQPVRVTSGGLGLELPVAWDYGTSSAQTELRSFSLAPTGREIDAEMHYALPLWAGSLSTSIYLRNDPGHFEAAPDDLGVALRFGMPF